MKRNAFIVLFGAVLLLMATALTEYLFYRQDENTWVERFESRLHEQERKADHLLATFRDSVDIDSEEWEEDLIFVGIREGRVFFWTNEIIGDRLIRIADQWEKFYEDRKYLLRNPEEKI